MNDRALCCRCGNLRTVSANYHFRVNDPNHSHGESDDLHPGRYWRCTGTLKCSVCKAPTRHALLRDSCAPEFRDFAEKRMA